VVTVSLLLELAGPVLLCVALVPLYGARGIWFSVFLSVSAFCNAGFDPLGFETPFISLTGFAQSPYVLTVIMLLIVVGGLGFVVWADLYESRGGRKKHNLHTRVVLLTTLALIAGGTLGIAVLEWNNPATLGAMSAWQKGANALFSSVTCRTAGFNSIDFAAMDGLTKLLCCGLMFIGAAPGSTGGGIKVTTITVVLMTVVCVVRGRDETVILGRQVRREAVYKTLAVLVIGLLAVGLAAGILYESLAGTGQAVSGLDAAFEAISAFATVGLSVGVTGAANLPALLTLIVSMYLGRVGPGSQYRSAGRQHSDRLTEKPTRCSALAGRRVFCVASSHPLPPQKHPMGEAAPSG
ncbi:MAG: potassium transporter TrkG, partial [Oscillospiraceae bacterium]